MVVCLLVVSAITTLLAIGPGVVLGTSSPASSTDFSIAVSPSIVPINPGFWGLLSAVSVGSNGFTGDVSLSAIAPAGFTGSVSVSPSTMGLVDGSCYYACVSDLDISSTDSIPVGYYNITITGTSGSLTHSTTMTLIVTIEDFSVMAGSGCGVQCFLTVSQGSAGTFPIQLKSINGFFGNVSLSDSVSYPPTLSASLNPATVSLSSGGSAISTLTVTVSDSTPPGSYPIEITGSSGLLWHGTSLTVVVTLAYFSVSANPTSLEIPLGSQRQTLTTVTWLNGLSNSILLQVASSSAAVSCVFASSNTSGLTVTEPASGSAYQYLKCAANGPVANYTVTIYGTSGPYQQSTILPVAVSVDPFVASPVVSVVVGMDGGLYSSVSGPGGSWNGWQSLSGSTPSTPTLCRSGPNRVDLLVRGNDDGIYHKAFISGVWSASWDKTPTGITVDQPVCAILGTTLYVVVRGATSELWATTLDLNTNTWAPTWTDLLGFSQSVPGLAASPGLNRLDLVVRGFDNGIYHKSFINGAWSQSWDSPSGATIGTPVAVSDGSSLHVVVIGGASSLWYNSLSLSSNTWTGWVYPSGATSSTPALVWTPGLNRLDLVVRGMDNGIYHKSL